MSSTIADRRSIRVAGLLALFASMILGSTAFAQSDDEAHEEALRLFQLGELFYEGGEYADAAESFSEAYALEPNAVLALNAALAYENSGQLETALEYFQLVLENEPDPSLEEQAERGVQRISAILESIEQQRQAQDGTLTIDGDPEGASVYVDGMLVGVLPYNEEISPGEHSLMIEAEGYEAFERMVNVNPGATVDILIDLDASETDPDPDPDNPDPDQIVDDMTEDPDAGRGSINLIPVYILGGVAAVGLTGGIIFAGNAQAAADAMEFDTEVQRDDELFEAERDFGQRNQMLSTISYSIAGAAALGAVGYLIFARPREREPDADTQVRIHPWVGGATLEIEF